MTPVAGVEAAALAAAAYASLVEPYWLRAVTYTVHRPEWPAGLDGLTIVHLSDLHGRTTLWNRAWARAWLQAADLVAVTGDLYSLTIPRPRLAARLGNLPPATTRLVTGNHDYRRGRVAIDPWSPAPGVLIDNRWEMRTFRGEPWIVAGIPDLVMGDPDWGAFDDMPEDVPAVLLSHRPDAVLADGAGRFGLVLSGHTHGGQVALPAFGPILLHSHLPRGSTAGSVERPSQTLVISRGLGTSELPVRFWCRPEVIRVIVRTSTSEGTGSGHAE